ncbi:MAG: T9SS type A sorting domain-containing protein [Bacteroidales bacterium]|nr:T9SS type A sorting domain-containing protein [Bacteroidales bacterium]MCF8351786.1 T9SS type A sorting domain-containing protein [Bacteroidales bacterium]MCF8377354.1 T9SS type A sorting domain-containing protein [Bacteroidales bacterium]MCF8401385.1 T9SS type A sorting domain-containing protein [Bacteroidales bacterium]
MTRYLGTEDYDRIHLNKLDENGNIIWQHAYSSGNWPVFNEEGWDLTIVNENRYLITGWCYYPDPGDTLIGALRPLFIMADSAGDMVWETPWVMDGYYIGRTRSSTVDNEENIYTAGSEYIVEESDFLPALLKTSPSGEEIGSFPIIQEDAYGTATTISWINDSTLFMSAGWVDNQDNDHCAFFKVDTFGNIIDSMNIIPAMSNGIYWTTKTFDDKFVSVGTHYDGNWDMYAFKVNENMEYDSIYTGYFEYDYLCPDSIETETYELECDIIVDIDEPFTTKEGSKMKVFPNPAGEQVTIQLPEYVITEKHSGNWDITKVNYQYNGPALLEFYDSFGKKTHSMEINSSQKEVSLDISGWKHGLYVVVLMKEGRKVDQQNLVVVD